MLGAVAGTSMKQAKDVARATVVLAYVGLCMTSSAKLGIGHLNATSVWRSARLGRGPILDDIKNYLEAENQKCYPRSPIETRSTYLKSWPGLLWYCRMRVRNRQQRRLSAACDGS